MGPRACQRTATASAMGIVHRVPHIRNIEAGVLMTDLSLASALTTQFENLVSANALRPVPGIG